MSADGIAAVYVSEVDLVRIDLPGQGHRVSLLLHPEQALRLLTAIKVALAVKQGPRKATK
jgi:hypothetical protein